MNYRRGFFRLWVVFSVAWIALICYAAQGSDGLSCMYGEHGPWCDYRWVPDLRTGLIYMLAGPGLMLAVGGLIDWVISGFRRGGY